MADPLQVRLKLYLDSRDIATVGLLGGGKDGSVWQTNRRTAIKIHARFESYHAERNAYIRFRDLQMDEVGGFALPKLREYDDDLHAIEMTIVRPPFILDFASAHLDHPPDFIEDPGHTLFDMVRQRFDERANQVIALYHELIDQAGVYLSDFHAHNIKFV